MARSNKVPSYRLHKPSGQAVVTLSGRDVYLGVYDSPESRTAYDAKIAEWLAMNRQATPEASGGSAGPTVEELLGAFWAHAQTHYRLPSGQASRELNNFRIALRPLRHLYAALPANDFGPLKLKAVRQVMIDGYDHPKYGKQEPLCRKQINVRCQRICRVFKWAVSEELVLSSAYEALKTVAGLQKGRTDAHESRPVTAVETAIVEQTMPHLPAQVAGLVRVQLLTGCRPGEVCALRLADLDRSGAVWICKPEEHKNLWRGKGRTIAIGPRAQAVMREFIAIRCPLCGVEGRPPRIGSRDGALCGPCADRMEEQNVCGPWQREECQDVEASLFSPEQAESERRADMRARRISKVQPSQRDRSKAKAQRKPGKQYTVLSYGQAITRACKKHGIPHWHPNQLRHTQGTQVRQRFGLEAAQVALGHSKADTTEIYAERDLALALKVAAEIG